MSRYLDGTIDSHKIIHMKRFLLVLLAIAVGHPVFAQLSAGAGYLKTHVSAERGSGSGEGFYAGLSYRIPLTSTFSLLPGLYFTRRKKQRESLSGVISFGMAVFPSRRPWSFRSVCSGTSTLPPIYGHSSMPAPLSSMGFNARLPPA